MSYRHHPSVQSFSAHRRVHHTQLKMISISPYFTPLSIQQDTVVNLNPLENVKGTVLLPSPSRIMWIVMELKSGGQNNIQPKAEYKYQKTESIWREQHKL